MNIKSNIKHAFLNPTECVIGGIDRKSLSAVKQDGMMLTVGLDFGTHQTKVCVESKGGVELSYTFLKFMDRAGQSFFTIPSIIGIGKDKHITYGYLPSNFDF